MTIDKGILNESFFVQFMLESMPQLVVQWLNNTEVGLWTPAGYFSTILSLVTLLNGIYKYGYYCFWLGTRISDVPTEVRLFGLIYVSIDDEDNKGKGVRPSSARGQRYQRSAKARRCLGA